MSGAAVYGFFIAIGFVLLTRVAPQPVSSVIWWSFCALQLTWNSTICWRRTGLPFASAGMGISAVVSALLAILATEGHVFSDLPFEWWVLVAVLMISGPVCLFVESRVHRTQWARWRDYQERKTAWDILAGRHIPRLRDTTRTGA
jgi:hypothetical protein